MPTSRKTQADKMIRELFAAIGDGWKLEEMRCANETTVRSNGRTWKVTRLIGLHRGRLEARIHILPAHGDAHEDSTGVLRSEQVPLLDGFTAVFREQGYRGYWDVADGPPRGFFRKKLQNLGDLRHERLLLERIKLGPTKARPASKVACRPR